MRDDARHSASHAASRPGKPPPVTGDLKASPVRKQIPVQRRSMAWLAWRSLSRSSGLAGALIGGGIVLTALLAPLLAPADPNAQDISRRLTPPAWETGGGMRNLLGTDHLGRDLLSRIVYGSRLTVAVGTAAVMFSTALGVALGLMGGFWRGKVDAVVSSLVDAWLSLPTLLIAVTVAGLLGASLLNLIFVLAITRWMTYTRVVRAEVLALREQEFVLAARALGAPALRILRLHVLPNVMSSILVISTLNWAQVVLIEASLNFLGLGVPPSIPSWGAMLNDGRPYIALAWWPATLPGLAIVITVLGINLLGDWMRDFLDPRLRSG